MRSARCFAAALGILFGVAQGSALADSNVNPQAPGFNSAASDPKAVALADATMAAMGGRAAWEKSRFFVWRFFGRRLHIWDRYTGRERIEFTDRKTAQKKLLLLNVNTKDGRVFTDGKELTDATERAAELQRGVEMWINDSYWLLMPYKLKDSGVTLRYKGVENLADGRPAEVLVLTFVGVGVTPENKYEVSIAKDTGLVEKWAYFEKASDAKPEMTTPWLNWHRYGGILLSGDRGKDATLSDLAVPEKVPDSVFTDPAPVDLSRLGVAAAPLPH